MKKAIPQTGLKLIACVTMLIDHLGYAFFSGNPAAYGIMRAIGRLAFPIYCFLTTEAVAHTKNPWKYLLRLAILAVLSEPGFDLMCFGQLTFYKQSVMVTLIMGAAMCIIMEKLPQYWMKPFAVLPFYWVMGYLRADYGANGILLIAMFMLTRYLPFKDLLRVLLFGALCWYMGGGPIKLLGLSIPAQWLAVFAIIPILLYSGEKGRANKWLIRGMNLFYPVHLAIIAAIKLFLL